MKTDKEIEKKLEELRKELKKKINETFISFRTEVEKHNDFFFLDKDYINVLSSLIRDKSK